jgi:hypothetical protein
VEGLRKTARTSRQLISQAGFYTDTSEMWVTFIAVTSRFLLTWSSLRDKLNCLFWVRVSWMK